MGSSWGPKTARAAAAEGRPLLHQKLSETDSLCEGKMIPDPRDEERVVKKEMDGGYTIQYNLRRNWLVAAGSPSDHVMCAIVTGLDTIESAILNIIYHSELAKHPRQPQSESCASALFISHPSRYYNRMLRGQEK
ncbi:hypothetical protein PoB_006545700 [Plakobranchus ocellatus]|uniref:Uncharacterized protein n=1 Tax=Plakobranchus ocellatus TaxID=259542 RepID=A0AAV4D4A1_9GAST|nr:hypothetical protein PoB_006545700 [Plakobranchus ocellatus]